MNIKDFENIDTGILIDRSRRDTKDYRLVEISRVGKKYVYVGRTAYYLKYEHDEYLTEKRDWGSPNLLFAAIDVYENWVERRELREWQWKVKNLKLTTDQLRRMKQIADESEVTNNEQ